MLAPLIAEAVRCARQDVRMGVRELAKKAKLNAGFLTRLEQGEHGVTAATCRRLARALGCSLEYLLAAALRTRSAALLKELRALGYDVVLVSTRPYLTTTRASTTVGAAERRTATGSVRDAER